MAIEGYRIGGIAGTAVAIGNCCVIK